MNLSIIIFGLNNICPLYLLSLIHSLISISFFFYLIFHLFLSEFCLSYYKIKKVHNIVPFYVAFLVCVAEFAVSFFHIFFQQQEKYIILIKPIYTHWALLFERCYLLLTHWRFVRFNYFHVDFLFIFKYFLLLLHFNCCTTVSQQIDL